MTTVTDEQIRRLNITSKDMVDWVEYGLKLKPGCDLPKKISLKYKNNIFFNFMPCMIPKLDIVGLKIVSRYPQREVSLKSTIQIFDLERGGGTLNATLDGNLITTWRTAAVAVHTIKILAKKDFKNIAVIGLGEVGKTFLKIAIDYFFDKKLTIKLFNYKGRAKEVAESFKNSPNVNFEIYDDYVEMVKDADVVVSAVTYVEEDFAKESVYKKGVLIVPIHTRGFIECDLKFDKIFCDDYGHISNFKYYNSYKNCREMQEVLAGSLGRENDEERILAYNIGIAIHDLVFAKKIVDMIKENSI